MQVGGSFRIVIKTHIHAGAQIECVTVRRMKLQNVIQILESSAGVLQSPVGIRSAQDIRVQRESGIEPAESLAITRTQTSPKVRF